MKDNMKSTVGNTVVITINSPVSPKKGKPVTVTSTYTYNPFTPLIHGFVSIPLSSTYETLVEAESP
ncbi:hypothetical protein [Bacillus taeanensis]|uniref:Uncharacterized protein n=1 Tax=Bacillus taeanensis TaxID=273032 RepID=A0A366XYY5_9BACI|nr:hypothetical protein [Bacillus taeanensis]RBW70355.1 hypothetical protein DS031_07260 [Bacillus taeanensis]